MPQPTRKPSIVADAVVFPPNSQPRSDIYRWPQAPLAHEATGGTSSTALDLEGARLIRVSCDEDTYIAFGDVTVVAAADDTSHLFLRGSEYVPVPLDANGVAYTHMAHIQKDTAGVIQVSVVPQSNG